MKMHMILWLVLMLLFLAMELMTTELTTIWFAGGALLAIPAAYAGLKMRWQLTVFFGVSFALLIFTRPLAMKYLNRSRTRTNADRLIGQTAVVTETIDNLNAAGTVKVSGLTWSARSQEDQKTIPAGSLVRIRQISGVKLIVEKEE